MCMHRLVFVRFAVAVVCLTFALLRPAAAQPGTAAWIGTSPLDATAYELAGNWIDLATGQVPALPPDSTSAVFFSSQAGQAPRDPLGNVLVSLRKNDLGARSM